MPSNDLAISIRDLSKSYVISHNATRHTTAAEAIVHALKRSNRRQEMETFWALKDVSFDVHVGDVIGIVGSNGAGKSTLLKILSRIVEPTSGRIDLYGRIGSLLEVGTGFHPELTGRENVFLNGAILGMNHREIQSHFDEIVAFAEVEKFLDTPVKRYSSGMYIRLAFAVAAHLDPEILIVDEVLAVGDAAFQKKCLGKMQDVSKQEGRTILFVSHNMAAVTQLCQRVLFFQKGVLVEDGPADAVVERYYGKNTIDAGVVVIDAARQTSRTGEIQPIQVLDITRFGSSSNSFQFRWREPIRLLVRFQVHQRLKNVTFGLGIFTQQGTAVFGSHHNDREETLLDFEPGVYECLIELENHLRPGIYSLEIGAENLAGKSTIFLIQDAVTFQVSEISVDDTSLNYGCHGIVNGYGRWQFRPSSGTDRELMQPVPAGLTRSPQW